MKSLEINIKTILKSGKVAIVPYIMAGDNGLDQLESQLIFLQNIGVAAIEIGIPFSDPVADGPVIQEAGLRALNKGVTLKQILEVLQKSQVTVPIVIMSYFNPLFHYGLEFFVKELQHTPVKGLIIPDLPYEHQNYIHPLLKETDIALIPLLSLTSPRERMKEIATNAEGFIYAVTVNGTTGERVSFGNQIDEHLQYLKEVSLVPVLAGFGVSDLSHVQRFGRVCDGVIIGSKVVHLLNKGKLEELSEFLEQATKETRASNS